MKTLKRYKIKYFFDGYGEGFQRMKKKQGTSFLMEILT